MKSPLKILSVIGTRPEAIKMAPLLLRLQSDAERYSSVVCATGQHFSLFDQGLGAFPVEVHYNLKLMVANQQLDQLTARALTGIGEVIEEVRPELVLVHGDTTTTLAGALSAYYQGVRVGHVEAGLRTGDLRSPFPEEANRTLTDRLADFCFAPTERNRAALLSEGVDDKRIFVTGNTAIDALFMVRDKIKETDPHIWSSQWGERVESIVNSRRPMILITAHRRENFGAGLRSICRAIRELAHQLPEWAFVYPVHLNPNVQAPAREILGDVPNVLLTEPLDYEPFVFLMNRAHLILTDSGGIQEEAPSLGKPVVVLREKTERQEAVEAGTVLLAGTDEERIVETVGQLVNDAALYAEMSRRINPYGDGRASERILRVLDEELAMGRTDE
jgi:UDP-N-acetylglucosamine 2-epimerase (non-hydrolysing)